MKAGLVSVCIPTFNGEKFLKEALFSVSQQSYQNIEVIISDDSSSDSTLIIAENFKRKSNFPVFIYNHDSSGIGSNWNNCILNSNGEYIKFLFQDDELRLDCIEKMVNILEENMSLGLVACKRTIINENENSPWALDWLSKYGDLQKNLKLPNKKLNIFDKEIFKHKEFCKDPFNKIGEPTAVMFKKNVIDKAGLFRTDLCQILDLEFYYRVLKNYKIAIINERLVEFRLHPGQASQNGKIDYRREYLHFRKILFSHFFKYLNYREKIKLLKETGNWIRL